MPGVVVRILVEVGQRVTRRQALVVVSAMKMETSLVAAHDGVVTGIRTSVGTSVRPGEILVEVQPDEPGGDDARR
jgi:biotin carboxyl carrier protein